MMRAIRRNFHILGRNKLNSHVSNKTKRRKDRIKRRPFLVTDDVILLFNSVVVMVIEDILADI